MGVLRGKTVIDCTHALAGPYASMVLADLGADVIKVEPLAGEVSRTRIGNYRGYDFGNRNKRTISIDFKTESGREVLRRLSDKADVFVENYRPGALDAWNLGYDSLAKRNPALVYCSVTGFGSNGPYRERAGLDLIAQAMSGVMSITGEPGGAPVTCGVPFADVGAGLFGTVGVLAALLEVGRSGHGQHVETSLFETAVAFGTWEFGPCLRTGEAPQAMGSRRKNVTPYGSYRTADGRLVVAINTVTLWSRFLQAMECEELSADARFSTLAGRLTNREAMEALLEKRFADKTTADWLSRLQNIGIPCSAVHTIKEAVGDEQLEIRGMFPAVDGEAYVAVPIHLSRTPREIRHGPHEVGQDTVEVLAEAGFATSEIRKLIASGAVGTAGG